MTAHSTQRPLIYDAIRALNRSVSGRNDWKLLNGISWSQKTFLAVYEFCRRDRNVSDCRFWVCKLVYENLATILCVAFGCKFMRHAMQGDIWKSWPDLATEGVAQNERGWIAWARRKGLTLKTQTYIYICHNYHFFKEREILIVWLYLGKYSRDGAWRRIGVRL